MCHIYGTVRQRECGGHFVNIATTVCLTASCYVIKTRSKTQTHGERGFFLQSTGGLLCNQITHQIFLFSWYITVTIIKHNYPQGLGTWRGCSRATNKSRHFLFLSINLRLCLSLYLFFPLPHTVYLTLSLSVSLLSLYLSRFVSLSLSQHFCLCVSHS